MSTGARIPLHVARQVADRLVAALAPACERIEIAGSIRRGKLDVGDLEIVAIPKRDNQGSVLDRLLDTVWFSRHCLGSEQQLALFEWEPPDEN